MTDFEETLRSALAGIELTEQEERYIRWLAGWDLETVETFAGLFEKCRKSSEAVVRCKNCVYYLKSNRFCCHIDGMSTAQDEMSFCSKGERRR